MEGMLVLAESGAVLSDSRKTTSHTEFWFIETKAPLTNCWRGRGTENGEKSGDG